MKAIKFLTVLMTMVALVSCSTKDETELCVEALRDNARVHMNDIPAINLEASTDKPYSNPVLIYGSSFGDYFQALYKTGKFEDMLKFTSSESIDKFGRDNILSFYKEMDFAYDIKLKSKNEGSGVTTLNYEAGIMATRNILRMDVVAENDSCKIVLKDLKSLR